MGWPLKGKFKLFQEQKGFTLIEVLVAVAILAAIGVVFMTSLGTAYRSVGVLDEQTQAEALARSQIEDIKNSAWLEDGQYPGTIDLPPQYSIVISVDEAVTGEHNPSTWGADGTYNTLKEITVSVLRPVNGGDGAIFSIKFYRTKK
jgi:prepilin-type N-terminal cleavage/methylation domain-containing protein